MRKKFFSELETKNWDNKTIIVDVDGTLTMDGSSQIDEVVKVKIKELTIRNHVFLFSNRKSLKRNQNLENLLQIKFIESAHKKPNKKVLDKLGENLKTNIVVIGDKTITDGFFAKNIGAEFVKVEHLRGGSDSLMTSITYLFDDILANFIQ